MKTVKLLFALALFDSLLTASCAAALARVETRGEATKVASPFDVTFHRHGPAASGNAHEHVAAKEGSKETDTPPQKMIADSSSKPFRQATNGSTPAGWIQIGSPRKWLFVIFDTGSDKLVAKTWETVAAELATLDQGISGMVLPSRLIYDHNASTSYHRKYIEGPHGEMRPMQSAITYGSGTAVTDVGTENVLVGNRSLDNFTIMEITADSLQLLHTSKGIAGVLGLQHMRNQSLGHSLFSRMRNNSLLTSFGYCRGTGNNGTFIWGDDSTDGQEIEVIGQMHWAMKLELVKVPSASDDSEPGAELPASLLMKRTKKQNPDFSSWPFGSESGDSQDSGIMGDAGDASTSGQGDMQDMPFDPTKILDGFKGLDDIFHQANVQEKDDAAILADICTTEKCTAILDTGSNIIAGPREGIQSITKLVNVKSDCSNFDQLPNIAVKIDGMDLSIPPSGYVMKVPMPTWASGAEHAMDGDGSDITGDGAASTTGDSEGGTAADGAAENLARDLAAAASQGADPAGDVVIEVVVPGYVRRHQSVDMGLAEQKATRVGQAATNKRWRAVFDRLHRHYGIDMREQVSDLLKQNNDTNSEFMCMPALVPLDKKTQYGPLWVVGTPLLDAYYARWSFGKDDAAPKIHLKALAEAQACKDGEEQASTGLLARAHGQSGMKALTRGPTERLPEEIRYPHWAKDLLHI